MVTDGPLYIEFGQHSLHGIQVCHKGASNENPSHLICVSYWAYYLFKKTIGWWLVESEYIVHF